MSTKNNNNNLIKVAVANVLTFLFLAFLVELMIYAALERPALIPSFLLDSFRGYYREKDRQIIQVTDCARYDARLFYLLAEGTCEFNNREFSTRYNINSGGLRDDESSLRDPRIIVLGDSYAMGWGVQQDESFPQLLERALGRKVLNAGVSSFGTSREMILLRQLDLDSAEYVVIQYHANDLEENLAFLANGNSLQIRPRASYDSLKKAIRDRQRYYPFKHLYGVSKSFAKTLVRKEPPAIPQTSEAQTFLDVLKQFDLRPDLRILTFKVDDYNRMDNDFARDIDSLRQTLNYRNMNIRPIRLGTALTPEDYFRLDDHIDASGHAKIAAKIQDEILLVWP